MKFLLKTVLFVSVINSINAGMPEVLNESMRDFIIGKWGATPGFLTQPLSQYVSPISGNGFFLIEDIDGQTASLIIYGLWLGWACLAIYSKSTKKMDVPSEN